MSGTAADAPHPHRPLKLARALVPVTRFLLPPEVGTPPPDILAYLRTTAEGARQLTRAHLLRADATSDRGAFQAAMEDLGAALAEAYERQFAEQRTRDPELEKRVAAVECRRGCSFCCHMNVGVTILEAARITAALRDGLHRERCDAVLAADSRLERRRAQERLAMKLLCPLLVDGACSIYEIRPIACRALLSLSARLCEQEVEAREAGGAARVPTLVTPRLIAAGYISGEVAALEDLGLASHLVELTAAVALLLREPATLDRWLDGQDAFPRL